MFEEDSRDEARVIWRDDAQLDPWTVNDYRAALQGRNHEVERIERIVREKDGQLKLETRFRKEAEAKAEYLERRLRSWSIIPARDEDALNSELNHAQEIGWKWPGLPAFHPTDPRISKVGNYACPAQISTRVRVARVIAWPIAFGMRTLDFIRTEPARIVGRARMFWRASVAPEIFTMTGRWPGKFRPEDMPIAEYRAWREAGGYR